MRAKDTHNTARLVLPCLRLLAQNLTCFDHDPELRLRQLILAALRTILSDNSHDLSFNGLIFVRNDLFATVLL